VCFTTTLLVQLHVNVGILLKHGKQFVQLIQTNNGVISLRLNSDGQKTGVKISSGYTIGSFWIKIIFKSKKYHAVRTVQNCFPCLSKMPTFTCSWTRSVVVKHTET
jgi:hypothetical protein